MELPRYGTPNIAYVSTWFGAQDDHPMWALNLMKYRAVAEYADGRESSISGADADMLYHPTGPLAAVGAEVRLITEVTHQLSGDATRWDRVAVAWYPSRMAMLEMQTLPEFQELHAHKDAGMAFTIVMATTPSADTVAPYGWSSLGPDDLMLVQVVADAAATDLAQLVPSRRIGRYDVRGVIVGDERAWAEARYDAISRDDVETLAAAAAAHANPSVYAVVVEPRFDVMSAG